MMDAAQTYKIRTPPPAPAPKINSTIAASSSLTYSNPDEEAARREHLPGRGEGSDHVGAHMPQRGDGDTLPAAPPLAELPSHHGAHQHSGHLDGDHG